ncbi:general secretion pathway protein GspB [Vibrio minamisatsumaniensis]|uniref:general secretion pathway protein GspB n=1 Tax=Vibrio minamisatsumaniensis TaxID=2910243 RepID=UPI003D20DDF3
MSRIMHELKRSSTKLSSVNQSSFKGYQNHHMPSLERGVGNKRSSLRAIGLLIIFVPSLLVGGALVYQSYSQQQAHLAKQSVNTVMAELEPQIVEVEDVAQTKATALASAENNTLFAVRVAPTNKALKALPRQEVYARVEFETKSNQLAVGPSVTRANTRETLKTTVSAAPKPAQPTVQPSASDKRAQPSVDHDLLQGLDLSQFSPDLALKLESMMGKQQSAPEPMDSRPAGQAESQVIELESHRDSLSGVLPKLDLQTHMYSSSEAKRWVKVNGHEVTQGDWIEQGIRLLEIKPQSVIIEFNQQKIEIPALYEWQG